MHLQKDLLKFKQSVKSSIPLLFLFFIAILFKVIYTIKNFSPVGTIFMLYLYSVSRILSRLVNLQNTRNTLSLLNWKLDEMTESDLWKLCCRVWSSLDEAEIQEYNTETRETSFHAIIQDYSSY